MLLDSWFTELLIDRKLLATALLLALTVLAMLRTLRATLAITADARSLAPMLITTSLAISLVSPLVLYTCLLYTSDAADEL